MTDHDEIFMKIICEMYNVQLYILIKKSARLIKIDKSAKKEYLF